MANAEGTAQRKPSLPIAGWDGTNGITVKVDASGNLVIGGGGVAAGATDSGNPLKVGGKYNLTLPVLTDAQRGDVQLDSSGGLRVRLAGTVAAGADAFSNNLTFAQASSDVAGTKLLGGAPFLNNSIGASGTWDRPRNNCDATVFASAARTADPTSFDGVNYNGRGLHLVIDVTAATSTPSTVFTIQGKDAVSGQFYTILASAAIVGVGTTILRVYPGLTVGANLVASDIIPRNWRVKAVHGNANSQTYSVGVSLIL